MRITKNGATLAASILKGRGRYGGNAINDLMGYCSGLARWGHIHAREQEHACNVPNYSDKRLVQAEAQLARYVALASNVPGAPLHIVYGSLTVGLTDEQPTKSRPIDAMMARWYLSR